MNLSTQQFAAGRCAYKQYRSVKKYSSVPLCFEHAPLPRNCLQLFASAAPIVASREYSFPDFARDHRAWIRR